VLTRWLWAPVLAAMVLAATACGGGGAAPTTPTSAAAAIGTTPEALPPQLQQELTAVAALRGLPAPPEIKVSLVAHADVPRLLESVLTASDRQQFDEATTLYRLLGHLRKDETYEGAYLAFAGDSVQGLYSPAAKTLWVVHPDGQSIDWDTLPREQRSTLAHELTHAVQDYHFDLDKLTAATAGDLDASLARTCVIEADAVLTERAYTARYLEAPGVRGLFASYTQAADAPASIQRELLFPYTTCVDWLGVIRAAGGQAAVDKLFTAPLSTADVLHPELLASGMRRASVALPDLAGALGKGWSRQSGGTFGEFQLRNYLQLRVPAFDASQAAAGWAGDRYDVYTRGGDSVAVFRVQFRDAGEARKFADVQGALLRAEDAKVSTSGPVTLSATNDGNTTARVAASGADVVFAIGSNSDVALRAVKAIAGG
jgi:hypothetical protein